MSQARPRIGVTHWEDIPGERIQAYWERLREAGAEPVDLLGPNAQAGVSALDGLVLTGGLDVCPERYGESRHPKVKHTAEGRDDFELRILGDALAADLPVLCICRGHQLLNVAFGGRLLQHIDSGEHRAHFELEGTPSRWHTVQLETDSLLCAIMGAAELEVNSRHHQAVLPETLASGLTPVGYSPDGLVEAVESHANRWLIGVQWHPELAEPDHPAFAPRCRPLFAALVAEASNVREPA